MNDKVDSAGGWTAFWRAITQGAGPEFTTFLTMIGVALIIGFTIAFIVSKVRNTGGDQGKKLLYGVLTGAVLLAPGAILPGLLTIIDLVVNALISLLPG